MPTITLFNKSNRNAGTYSTAAAGIVYPANLRSFQADVTLDAASLIDPTLALTWKVDATFDGTNWVLLVGGGWQGGLDSEGNPKNAPNQTWQTSGPLPQRVRGELTVSKRVSLGLVATIN